MEEIQINSFKDYVSKIEKIRNEKHKIILFRGQSKDLNLLPSIAKENPKNDTTNVEREMLEELKRRSQLLITRNIKTDLEWLVFAQHFGLKTRLLDWSSNPLTALWFSCKNEYSI